MWMLLVGLATVLVLSAGIGAGPQAARADEDDTVFGVVIKGGSKDILTLATEDGVRPIKITSNTKLGRDGKVVKFNDIVPGEQVAATVQKQRDGARIAIRVKLHPGAKAPPAVTHVTGIIVESKGDKVTLSQKDGKQTTVEVPSGTEIPKVAEAVTIVARKDGDYLEATYIERVESTVKRLQDALSKEVDEARQALLKELVKKGSEAHLSALNSALDRIHSEARKQIEEAFQQFRISYSNLAADIGAGTPQVTTDGTVIEVSGGQVTVAPSGGGDPATFIVQPVDTVVTVGGDTASISDIVPGQQVTVAVDSANGGQVSGKPVATSVEVTPPLAATAAVFDTGALDATSPVEGTIVSVDLAPGLARSAAVVLIADPETGGQSAAVIDASTVVTVNGATADPAQLEPGQDVKAQMAPDGVTAEQVVASDPAPAVDPDPDPAAAATAAPAGSSSGGTGSETVILQGTLTSTDGGTWVISSVTIGPGTLAVEGDMQPGKKVKIIERTNPDGSKSLVALVTGP